MTLLLLLLLLAGGGLAQQVSPLQGQGFPPEPLPPVYVSAVLDRMLNIDDSVYRFECVLYIYLSWSDARAYETAYNATIEAYQSGSCQRPCSSTNAWSPGQPCCDGVWLPDFSFTNVKAFSQDRVVSFGIILDPNSTGVAWWNSVQGEFYTPLSFKAFPFDKQFLVVQLEYGEKATAERQISILPSLTSTQMFQPKSGAMVSGWRVTGLQVLPYSYPILAPALEVATYSHPDDPAPLRASKDSVNAGLSVTEQRLNTTGFVISITVSRQSGWYIISAIFPVAVNVFLALLVFAVHPKHLDTRLGVVVTLFLALTAVQYVLAGYLPSSSDVVPTQQLIIVSYCVLALIGISSIATYSMTTFQSRHVEFKRQEVASRQFSERWRVVKQAHSGQRWDLPPGLRQRRGSKQEQAAEEGGLAGPQPRSNGSYHSEVQGEEGLEAGATRVELPGLAGPDTPSPPHSTSGSGGGTGSDSDGDAPQPQTQRRAPASEDSAAQVRVGAVQHCALRDDPSSRGPPPGPPREEAERGWWLLRWLSCGQVVRRRRGGRGGAQLNWFQLQRLKVAEMAVEMEQNRDYAVCLAMKVDHFMFFTVLGGYLLAVVLIFAISAQENPELVFSS